MDTGVADLTFHRVLWREPLRHDESVRSVRVLVDFQLAAVSQQ